MTKLDGSTDTFTQKDDNTTYSAGNGLSLSGTTFSHADTSSQASLTESNRRYIKSLTLDTYGHVTALTTGTETVTDTNTTYSAGTGLSLSGTTFNVSTVPIANGGTGATTAAGAANNLLSRGTSNGDFNTKLDTGHMWTQLPSCTNAPQEDGYGHLEVIRTAGAGNVLQRWTNYSSGDTWVRCSNSSTSDDTSDWQSWSRLLDSNNYSSYALPLTGGTLTGNVVIKRSPPSLHLQSTAVDKGTAASTSAGGSIWFMDKNGTATANALGRIYGYNSSNGYNAVRLYAYKQEADSTDTAYLYVQYGSDGVKKAGSSASFYGAVWNDYAEFRGQKEEIEPGYCVTSNRDGKVSKTTKRMQYCEGIVSDTFGFSIGETDECKTPLAVSGRVLAYYSGDIQDYEIGDVVCANADGKITKMTREEIRDYPDRIVGTVSEIPSYDTWGDGNVPTAGRIWIKVK